MIVAGLQIDIAWENPTESFRRADEQAERAAATGARMLVLPEMFATGFSMQPEATVPAAEASLDYLERLARTYHVWVVGGHAEAAEPRPYNALTIINPDGEQVLRYRKIHPFSLAGEHQHYAGGESVATTTVEGVRVTPLICYDLRFPELFRPFADTTDLFVVIANWPERRGYTWRALVQARAMDNQAYVLGVNRVGEAQGMHHRGSSTLVDPNGIVTAMIAEQPGVVVGEVDPQEVQRSRAKYGFLADRRPEVYARLGQES
jgi:predicted amidohydrolase